VRPPSLKFAPIWLPIAFLLRDIAAWVYVFSYEPGITEKAVRIHHFLLIPGVFFSVEWSTVINIAFGIGLGFALREAAVRHFPMAFSLAVLTWNFILTGVLDFWSWSEKSDTVLRLYRVGMLPGKYVGHLLSSWKILSNGQVLFVTGLAVNFALAILATAAYLRIFRSNRREPSNP
jgi:hypothetical protein